MVIFTDFSVSKDLILHIILEIVGWYINCKTVYFFLSRKCAKEVKKKVTWEASSMF